MDFHTERLHERGPMQESLYDRFRPFKPYDLVLAVIMFVLMVSGSALGPTTRGLVVVGGLVLLCLLDFVQRMVRVPTPLWQAMAIVCINALLLTLLSLLNRSNEYTLSLAMLIVAFATVAFGQHLGIIAAILTMATLAQRDYLDPATARPPTDWMLFLAVLFTLVFILVRINQLQQDALFDVVTSLRNHRYFQVRLREELHRSDRNGKPTSLILLDLDDFKSVNDRYGHAAGDRVLRRVARILAQNVRAADVICRYGGDEITVILPETSQTDASLVSERFRHEIAKQREQSEIGVSISIGVAVYPDHAATADELIASADAAMYRAKRAGKNMVCLAEAASNPKN